MRAGFFPFVLLTQAAQGLIIKKRLSVNKPGQLKKKGDFIMSFSVIHTPNAPAAIGPYSQAIVINGMLYTSGQIGLIPESGQVAGDSIEAQAEQCCKNLGGILEAAGTDFSHVIKTTCFLADIKDFAVFNAIYEKYFVSKPARSCVAVRELPKSVLCEIEVIAAID